MANLLTDLVLTSVSDYGGTFADITGMSDSVAIAGTGSVVILMTSNIPVETAGGGGDACAEYRFTVDGSPVGPELSALADTGSEFSGREIIFAVDGLSTGNHTFAVQARNRSGSVSADTTRERTFQVLEIVSGASLIVDVSATDVDNSPAAWANISGLSASATPQLGSVLLMLAGLTPNEPANDECAEYRFAIDGARDGPYSMSQNDNVNEVDGMSMAWAVDGVTAASHTFSVQWQDRVSSPDTDNGRTRILQVIEFTQDVDLLVDSSSVTADNAPASFADMDDMTGSPDIDSVDSVALVLANYVQNAESSTDKRADSRLTVGGVFEGAIQAHFRDDVDRTASTMMARAFTGESGVTDFAMEWEDGKDDPNSDTARERTFQVLDIKAGAITATGAPEITKPTSTGAAVRKITASGTPEITKPISTGSAIRKIVASGAPSITKPTATGTAIRKITANGAPSITKPTSTGEAILIPLVPPEEDGSTVNKYGREDQHRDRLETEDEEILAIVIAATTAIFDDLD